jgi:very-short-patch-repair endonuclease
MNELPVKPKRVRRPRHAAVTLQSELEAQFSLAWRAFKPSHLPDPEIEYRFDQMRKYKLDFAWPKHKLAVEVEGGQWKYGRHVRGAGFEEDCRKYNLLVMRGWRLLRFSTNMVANESPDCVALVVKALEGESL